MTDGKKLDDCVRTKYIWIFRKGNGQAAVHPSPAILQVGDEFLIVNKTEDDAIVVFPEGFVREARVDVPRRAARPATATGGAPYFEYDVTFARGGYAEGGSKPGVIIEP